MLSSRFCLDEREGRLPRNHRTILAAIRDLAPGDHLTAHDVFVRARSVQPHIGFATVHRGLARLHELGYVNKLDLPGAPSAVYEPAAAPHAHFRCVACGRIRDVAFSLPDTALAALGRDLGVAIDAAATTFTGRCAECAAAGAPLPA